MFQQTLAGLLALASAFMPGAPARPPLAEIRHWAAIYAPPADPLALAAYDLVVLEADHAVPPEPLRAAGTCVIAYLSLGEIHRTRPIWARARAAGLLLGGNSRWPDASFVDPRSPQWHRMVVDEIAPDLLSRGYDGFFLDTIDDAAYLEDLGTKGAKDGMLDLVGRLRRRFPGAIVIANGGLGLMPRLGDLVDAFAHESVWTRFDFGTRTYSRRPEPEAAARLSALRRSSEQAGKPFFPLEYAGPDDTETRAWIYRTARAHGLAPYVGPIELDRLIPEPAL